MAIERQLSDLLSEFARTLKQSPVDIVKMDREFVTDLEPDLVSLLDRLAVT